MDRIVGATKAIEGESEIEPCLIILGILLESFVQQRLGGGKIAFLNSLFGLGDFRRLIVDQFLVMANGGMGLRQSGGG
jgi:hypothetical protein